jgi:hypothetical protein
MFAEENNNNMPVLFYYLGIKFFFYTNDHEPIHVHVSNGNGEARYRIDPVKMISNHGMKERDLRIAEAAIEENREVIIENWNKCFNR